MIEWLKDVLGINPYRLAWSFKMPSGKWYDGKDKFIYSKRRALRLARGLNRDYGAGPHWVERA